MLTYNLNNLANHNVTVVEVDEVLNDPRTIWIDLGVSRDGNDRLMFVGLTKVGRAIEVGVELVGEDEHVFHAMDAGKRYLKELNHVQKRNSKRKGGAPRKTSRKDS